MDDTTSPTREAPPEGTIERWAWDYVTTTDLSVKLAPPPVPAAWDPAPARVVLERPGRPEVLTPREVRKKTPRPGALKVPARRAEVLHTFLHHELQAAELLCWALLAFPDAPPAFRSGVLGICQDELRHIRMYHEHLERLGHHFGEHPVNDWFWRRIPTVASPAHFVARLGIGFEGGNLDHSARFRGYFQDAGDPKAVAIQARIVEEEIPHAAFALRWFRTFTGGLDFESWRAHLPAPLSPLMMRGLPLNLEARREAGYPEDFLAALAAWGTEREEARGVEG